jgi:vacuolar-type H+-ATPase subunit E/Vma4
MSTQQVADKILQDAQNEARKIIEHHQEKINNIKKEFTQTLAVERKEIETQAEELKRTEITRAIAQEKLQYNKQLTEKKQHLINAIIDQALTTLNKQDGYGAFLKALITRSNLRTGELHISEKDWKIHSSALEQYFKKEKLQYTIIKDSALSGGVTLTSGKTTHHGSLDLIRELLHDELTIAVSRQLQ